MSWQWPWQERLVLEIRRSTETIEANESFLCTRMASIRKTENYKILQTLWAHKRSRIVEDIKKSEDKEKTQRLSDRLSGFDEAANMAMQWARRDPKYKEKEKEALRKHAARMRAALKGENA